MGPLNITGVLTGKQQYEKDRHIEGEGHVKTGDWSDARTSQGLPKIATTSRSQEGARVLLEVSEGASRAVRQYISVVLNHLIFGTLQP